MSIATWNINGGVMLESVSPKRYGAEGNISYYIDVLRAIDPDVVCLQEIHFYPDGHSQADEISRALGLSHVFQKDVHVSHLLPGRRMGQAVISRFPLEDRKEVLLPYPSFELKPKDGRVAARHDKYLLITKTAGVTIATTQFRVRIHRLARDDR